MNRGPKIAHLVLLPFLRVSLSFQTRLLVSISPTFYDQIFAPKKTNLKCKYKKAVHETFVQKPARKMLGKLTLGVNFTNIYEELFCICSLPLSVFGTSKSAVKLHVN